ncbi:apolipoprotein N-acyltransferase [Peristeroidobacter agariperforans]|uniref:apolipoprotein N-acyltransferase n=1 Tax=Peristeroidobacter agariperforans TaxID=268404 RepID=UPI0018E53958|nr:apolipoprotein N-acyltransferase [Peristeroidobacter agariperforans]
MNTAKEQMAAVPLEKDHAVSVRTFKFYTHLSLPVGAAVSLAFAPFNLWPLAMLCFSFLFLAWEEATPKQAAKRGFLFTAGTYLAGTYWLYHSIHTIGNAPLALTAFVMLALVAIMSAYMALVGYALKRWIPAQGWIKWLLVLPAAIVILEWFRGWFLSGFPWLALGYTQTDTWLAGFAPVGGVYTVSLAVTLCAGAIVAIVLGNKNIRIAAAGVVGVLWLIGFSIHDKEWTEKTGEPISVAIVQGAVPQEMKWQDEQRDKTIALYRGLTREHLGTKLIIWPEAALPGLSYELHDVLSEEWTAAHAAGSALVLGQVHFDPEEQVFFNAVLALDKEPQWYAKRRLVPLTEYFPKLPTWLTGWLRSMELPYSGFKAGVENPDPLDAAGQKLALTICYEDAYASEQLDVLKSATLLVNVTNDAWFGDSTAAHQHLQISRMRALEAGRQLLRAANDGISAIIAANGVVEKTFPRFKPGVLTGDVQPRIGLTPYAKVGNWPVIILSLLFLLAGLWPLMARRKTQS